MHDKDKTKDSRPLNARNPRDPQRFVSNWFKLPEQAWALLPGSGEPIKIDRGEDGYSPIMSNLPPLEAVKHLNQTYGVTSAQAHAMLHGSMFGFDTPGADPDNAANCGADVPSWSDYVANSGDSGTTVLDFGVLLKKYMKHVALNARHGFLGEQYVERSGVRFTHTEGAALEGLANEITAELKKG